MWLLLWSSCSYDDAVEWKTLKSIILSHPFCSQFRQHFMSSFCTTLPFRQKMTNLNCMYRKALRNTCVKKATRKTLAKLTPGSEFLAYVKPNGTSSAKKVEFVIFLIPLPHQVLDACSCIYNETDITKFTTAAIVHWISNHKHKKMCEKAIYAIHF